MHILKAKQ